MAVALPAIYIGFMLVLVWFSSARCREIPETGNLDQRREAAPDPSDADYPTLRLVAKKSGAESQSASQTSHHNDNKDTDSHASSRRAITAVLTAQQEAWNRGDVDAFLVGYWNSPDLTFSGSGGISRGWDGVLARYKKNYPDRASMGDLDFSHLEFRFIGDDAALILGHWHLKREKDDLGGVFSLVWQRFPEGWRIIHDHTSATPPEKK